MDRIHLMSAFVAVVDCRSFAGAARKLSLSPPSITRAVAELEGRLGVRLLTRTTRSVRTTDAGATYVEDCRRILSEIEEADSAATGAHGKARGHLTITAPVLLGRTCVSQVVVQYLRTHPDVTASCWFVDRVVNMIDEGADVAIRIGHLPDSSLHAYHVGRVRHVVCASPEYLRQSKPVAHPNDLLMHPIISANAVTPTTDWKFAGDGGTAAVRVGPRIITTTNDSAIAMAVGGFGITRLMSYQAAPYIAAGTLAVVLEGFEPPPIPVHVVHHEGRRASRKVRSFVELAVSMLSNDPAIS